MKIVLVLVPSPDCWRERLLGTSTMTGFKGLSMNGAVPLLPLYATMVWTEESFTSVFLSFHFAT